MSLPPPTVHIVDDDPSLRTALSRLLRAAGYEVRAHSSVGEFMLTPHTADAPACVVLDVCLPGPNGLDFHEAFSKREDALPIIFLTGHGDIAASVRAMKAGAVDFLTKPVERKALLDAVQNALARDAQNRTSRQAASAVRARYRTLTARERAVFTLVVAGKLNKQIAGDLGISERTVKARRAKVMEKMQVTSLAELVHLAGQLNEGSEPQGSQ